MNELDLALVDWSRAQFALTAIYHWFFVPLTLGLSFLVAFMHTIYYKTGSDTWKAMTKFWMKLFGINFAIGVATGIILEFEFGTNWSNYSWFVGDIFGAPLAIEGIFAFFLESTFIAVMFFGWTRVSKKFHMISSWLVAFGSNLSALWILVANAWMQNPVGMKFNPDTARNEMVSFFDVLLSPTAVSKFLHTVSSSYIIAALFVMGISAWYLLHGRYIAFAKRSIVMASVFGLLAALFTTLTGDIAAYNAAQRQPMKFAAMEGLYKGEKAAGITVIGLINAKKQANDDLDPYHFEIKIPGILSYFAKRDFDAFVPGIEDILNGNPEYGFTSVKERMEKGKVSIKALAEYRKAKKAGDEALAAEHLNKFEANYQHFGYGYLKEDIDAIPPISTTFYSFHLMVILGGYFILLFAWAIWASTKPEIEKRKLLLRFALWSIPLGYIASQLGWAVAEVGRQPWTIQDVLPVHVATSNLNTGHVKTTFFIFLVLFTALLIAEIRIMIAQIKKGPDAALLTQKGGQHV